MAEADTKRRRQKTARAALQYVAADTDLDHRSPEVQKTILALARGGWLKNPHRKPEEPPTTLVDATGTARRLQALVWEGWSVTAVASYLSLNPRSLQALARGETRRCETRIADEVAEMFEDPPEPLEQRPQAAAKALGNARRLGYVPRERWAGLDIDDPGVHPHPVVVE